MVLVQIQATSIPCQIDDFEPDVERSVKGALHFVPASTKTLTKGELLHIQKHHTELASCMLVVKDDEAEPVAETSVATPTTSVEPTVEDAADGVEGRENKRTTRRRKAAIRLDD